MSRSLVAGTLLLLLLQGGVLRVQAQSSVEDPVVSRGSLLFEVYPSTVFVDGVYAREGGSRIELASTLFGAELNPDPIPSLAPTEARFRALARAEDNGGTALRLGSTVGRVTADEQVLPIRITYGALDRITVGATFPFVRKRVDTLLRISPAGATVGTRPGTVERSAFLGEALGALTFLRSAVEEECSELGESDPSCQAGEALVHEVEGFLGELDSTWAEELLFPLEGSVVGSLIGDRWTSLQAQLADVGAEAPELLPLATDPVSDADFRALVLNPAWPGEGFPVENSPSFLALGDVELHVAVPLFDRSPEGGFRRARTAVVGTLRLPTGEPDSLLAVAPTGTSRGVGGGTVRLVSDLAFTERLALLAVVEGGWSGSTEVVLLAPDPDLAFTPGGTRAPVRWEPGGYLRLSLAPRVHLGRALSLGGSWQLLRRGGEAFTALGSDGIAIPSGSDASSAHLVGLEFRYAALQGPDAGGIRYPIEVFLRGSRTVRGSGAPVQSRFDAGLRIVLRR